MPTLTISQPKANQVVAVADRFQVSGRATDSGVPKAIKIVVTVQIDNGPAIKAQLKSVPNPKLTIVDFSAAPAVLGEGPHVVTVNATFGQSSKLTKPVKVRGVRNLPAGLHVGTHIGTPSID